TPALSSGNANRNGIDIQTSGTASTVPAVYACNLDGDAIYNEADDGQKIACNFLSWDDVAAFLDWAALRPLTELEYEKAARGTNTPVANEFAWGNTSATALSGLTNPNQTGEIASNGSANITYNNAFTSGPTRVGIFATGSSSRASSGAGYYGAMELSGNLWERCVTVGNSSGRPFSGLHGNGSLTTGGAADVSGWPAAAGAGLKGGSWLNNTTNAATSSFRGSAANGNNTRDSDVGGRGARTDPAGIVTDGLILWLDAGITSSYPTSGTIWTDLSGNKNNGTISGATYSNGALIYGASNVTSVPMNNLRPTSGLTQESWVLFTSNVPQVMIGAQYGASSNNSYAIWLDNTNLWACGVNIGGGFNYQTYSATININTYYHVIHTYDGANQKLYLNGNLILTWATSGSIAYDLNNTQLAVGNDWNSGYNSGATVGVRGSLAKIAIYNRALSASEVLQNFNAQKARFGL
ncbi:MAG: hypothetical protein FGM61_08905, partial [Sediminibacterium sp.]|nr:hypothetical protein [Sediminibacterium sp.]